MMIVKLFFYSFIFLGAACKVFAEDSIKSKQLGNNWIGLTSQVDPFDKQKREVIQISKGDFTFRCGQLNMEVDSYGFESISFDADMKYISDSKEPVNKKGQYSTYLGGSNMVTNSRYYSFSMTNEDIDTMKSGAILKVAGKYSENGWETKSISLKGFSHAYSQMCKNEARVTQESLNDMTAARSVSAGYFRTIQSALSANITYPPRAFENGDEGECLVRIYFIRNGNVTNFSLQKSTGSHQLDEACLAAALKTERFPPVPDEDSPEKELFNIVLPLRFSLPD